MLILLLFIPYAAMSIQARKAAQMLCSKIPGNVSPPVALGSLEAARLQAANRILSYGWKTNMKTIALIAAVLIGSSFVVQPATASAGNTSRWIQMGISAANTARQVSKARKGDGAASAYGQINNNSGGLLPKLLKRRSY